MKKLILVGVIALFTLGAVDGASAHPWDLHHGWRGYHWHGHYWRHRGWAWRAHHRYPRYW